MNLDAAIDSLLSPIADKVSGLIFSYVTIGGVKVEFLIALLISAALYFTFRTGFIGLWGFKHSIKLITNNYVHNNPNGYQRKKVNFLLFRHLAQRFLLLQELVMLQVQRLQYLLVVRE